jgi:hypothetical protein
MSTIKVNKIENTATADGGIAIDASGHVQIDGQQLPTAGALSNRNLIINGDMRIDQRNAGASVTPSSGTTYTVDRWFYFANQASKFTVQQNAGSVTPPTGFKKYLGFTVAAAVTVSAGDYFLTAHRIEGFNVEELEWGTSNAQSVTISFWVRSSLTGSFGASIQNGASNRSYPFSYSISAANTWEHKTVTIPGDTSGTWETGNSGSVTLWLGLGVGSTLSGTAGSWSGSDFRSVTGATSVVGTSAATFYITGVQLEVGEKATSFEHRSYGDELAMCQRYFQFVPYFSGSSGYLVGSLHYHYAQVFAPMRITPAAPTPTGSGTVSIAAGGADGYRYPILFVTTDASTSTFYTASCSAEL